MTKKKLKEYLKEAKTRPNPKYYLKRMADGHHFAGDLKGEKLLLDAIANYDTVDE